MAIAKNILLMLWHCIWTVELGVLKGFKGYFVGIFLNVEFEVPFPNIYH
jgi:hypothetical protein